LNKRYAAEERGSSETGDITHYTTTNRDDERFTVGTGANEIAGNALNGLQIFCGFGVVEEMHLRGLAGTQAAADAGADGAPDLGRGENVDAGEFAE
jgi:hypothetical protein